MTNAVSAATTAADARRMRSLKPYLDRLRTWYERQSATPDDRPARVQVGGRTLVLEGWERQHVCEIFRTGKDLETDVLLQAIALATKCMVDMERMAAEGSASIDSLYKQQSEIMLDAALGRALLREVQVVVDRAVMSGEVETAKRLSQFRHKLHRVLAEVKAVLAESEPDGFAAQTDIEDAIETAIEGSPEPVAVEESPGPRVSAIDLPSAERVRRRRPARRRPPPAAVPEPESEGWGLTPWLLGILVVVGGAALAVQTAYGPRANPEPPGALSDLLRKSPVVVALDARPPSFFVEVDPAEWGRLETRQRWDLVKSISSGLPHENYKGVLLRTPERRPVAQWLQIRGVELLEEGRGTETRGGRLRREGRRLRSADRVPLLIDWTLILLDRVAASIHAAHR